MKILLATSEAVPFAKTGGLADVCGALPIELARLGHEVTLIMPAYSQIEAAGLPIETTDHQFSITIGRKQVSGLLLRGKLPGGQVTVYFVEQNHYFHRDELYRTGNQDYQDNCERFVFFCRAVMESIRLLNLEVDILHVNDWQTGLIPAYLKTAYRTLPGFERIASLITVHNIAYQGTFWHWDMLLTGLDWKYFNWHQMEFFGNLNLLKTGLVFADAVNTVSPRYAEEIQSPPLGAGLEGVLQQRRSVLSGILNGVDYQQWNPATDKHLVRQYGPKDAAAGKAASKAALQAELGLPQKPEVPLLAFVGRLVDQKGIDLIAAVMQDWLQHSEAQWVILGTGEQRYHDLVTNLARHFPNKLAARLEFSDALAHRIEAAADVFLMPSQFEPCGLSQMYSLKYGTVPLVRATGGLADTIYNASEEGIAAGKSNGFVFHEHTPRALNDALRRALDLFAQPEQWKKLVAIGMGQDWSWANSAKQYVALYEKTLARVRSAETVAAR